MIVNKFKNKKVVVMGLGLNGGGVGVAKFFSEQGARVLVTDLKNEEELKPSIEELENYPNIEYALGGHKIEDFETADLIVKNPGVPPNSSYLAVAKRKNVPIKSDIEIFFDLCPAKIIGITGTKGKSTTATLVYLFLKQKFRNAALAGNIGVSPLELLKKISKTAWVVLELSSFELEDLEKSPKIAVFTTIFPDHLNRYPTFDDYVNSKKSIFKFQKKSDFLVLNFDNEITKNFSLEGKSKILFFSKNEFSRLGKKFKKGAFLKNNSIFFGPEKKSFFDFKNLKLEGEHNIFNVLAAVSVAKILKVQNSKISKVLSEFSGVKNRQEFIAKKRGISYYNDTTATNPEAAIVALDLFKRKYPSSEVILIAGGQDKNLDFKNFAKKVAKDINFLILLPGTATDKILKELELINDKKIVIFSVYSMKDAVEKAEILAKPEDVVLLSPGAASFGLFKNEFDRGDQFVKIVKELKD